MEIKKTRSGLRRGRKKMFEIKRLIPLMVVFLALALQGCEVRHLTVTKVGDGSVTSAPVGIDCGGNCNHDFDHNAVISLTAQPAVGAIFAGWAWDCTGSLTTPCQVTLDTDRRAFAAFCSGSQGSHNLKVTMGGAGSGSVVSVPAMDSDCGPSCFRFDGCKIVIVSETANGGSRFNNWWGCLSIEENKCLVVMDSDREIIANFDGVRRLSVEFPSSNTGTGTVTSDRDGINCPSDCGELYTNSGSPAVIKLTARPDEGSIFDGWLGGGCDNQGNPCFVTMDQSRIVSASFINQFALTVHVSNTNASFNRIGGGRVLAGEVFDVAGNLFNPPINCGKSCVSSFRSGTWVTVQAVPNPGSYFLWGGDACKGTFSPTCFVLMGTAPGDVSVTFKPNGT